MSKRALGYIASHPFWGDSYIPQRIQNNLVKTYAESKDLSLIWSIPEVSILYRQTPALSNFLKSNKKKVEAVIFISYQMNHPSSLINSLNHIINQSIEVHFVIENCFIKNVNQLEKLTTEITLSYLLSKEKKSPLIDLGYSPI